MYLHITAVVFIRWKSSINCSPFLYIDLYSNLGGTQAEFTLNLTATCFACCELPKEGSSWWRPVNPPKKAQGQARHPRQKGTTCAGINTYLRIYRLETIFNSILKNQDSKWGVFFFFEKIRVSHLFPSCFQHPHFSENFFGW